MHLRLTMPAEDCGERAAIHVLKDEVNGVVDLGTWEGWGGEGRRVCGVAARVRWRLPTGRL